MIKKIKDYIKFKTFMWKAKKEIKHCDKTGIPRCMKCKTEFKQTKNSKYQWEPQCKCMGNIMLCRG